MALDATVRARVDSQLKADTEKIFAQLGLTMSQAIVLFLKAVVREQGLPLEMKVDREYKHQNNKELDGEIHTERSNK